jgi:homoserine dehydrogenase
MIGGGVVGGGVYEIIMNRLGGSSSAVKNNTPVITKICVRDATKSRDFHIDNSTTEVVTDVKSIVNDENIDIVVEVMGGVGLAKTAVMESLRRGKSVVTANSKIFCHKCSSLN